MRHEAYLIGDILDGKSIIVSKTPLRITFVGGGTDLPSYYRNYGPGAVTSAAINKYIYILIHKNFDNRIRVNYSKSENVESVDDVEHPTVREALKLLEIEKGLDIFSIADIPVSSGGIGLGSSGAFLVGLLNALHAWKGEMASPKQLAEEAIEIEINRLNEPCGRQDQYIAAYGGTRFFEFEKDDKTHTKPIILNQENRRKFSEHLLLFYTHTGHQSNQILKKQGEGIGRHTESYNRMRDMAYKMYDLMTEGKWHDVGRLLHENWQLKKTLSDGISDSGIDATYNKAMENGAIGGKIIGAGGGGFFLFFADPEKQNKIINALHGIEHVPFEFEQQGSRVISLED